MKTIYLDTANAEAMDELRAQFSSSGADRDAVVDLINGVVAENLSNAVAVKAFSGQSLADEDGGSYEAVDFQILSSYRIDGDTYFSGSEFRLNYSHYARELLELVEEAFAGVDVAS